MFFYLSKILWLVFQPSALFIFLTIIGLVLLTTRWAEQGRKLALASILTLLTFGFSPLGNILILPLEARFSRAQITPGSKVDGIIILGGAIDGFVSQSRSTVTTNEAAERMIEAARLARRWPGAKILYSGGSSNLIYKGTSEAILAKTLLADLGIDRARVILERVSRNTFENAVQSKVRAQPKTSERWLLVTSAYHMPRSVGCFRAAGFNVEPWPVDYRTRGRDDRFRFFTKPSEGLRRMDLVSREWLGLIAYRLTGRTASLFPAP